MKDFINVLPVCTKESKTSSWDLNSVEQLSHVHEEMYNDSRFN